MRTLRFYAIIFSLTVSFFGLNSVKIFGQPQSSTPQIAKNTSEPKLNREIKENDSVEEENHSDTCAASGGAHQASRADYRADCRANSRAACRGYRNTPASLRQKPSIRSMESPHESRRSCAPRPSHGDGIDA